MRAVLRWTEFYKHESCGKCTPCREGTWWLVQTLARLEKGKAAEGDLELLLDQCDNILGRSFCALGDGATSPITSSIQYFRDEYIAHFEHGGCPFDPAASTLFATDRRSNGMTTDTAGREDGPRSATSVTLTIDGVEVSVPKGTLVIRAAEQIGVQIPRFCDHPLLDPVGACRQCLVEVTDAGNGRPMPKPQASCTIAVSEGMVVKTQLTSPVADKAQQGVMEFLLINHPLDCPVCDKGGECPLQNQAMSNGRGETRFTEVKRTFPKPINISTQVLLDRERCVLCARCTRFSEQIAGDPFIALVERGALQQVGIYEEEPFESYFSGNTVQICPVGALTGAAYRFRSRPFDLVSTPSVAEHYACGCAMRVDHRRGKVMRRLAGNDPEVNEEWITDKDRFAFRYATLEDRLTVPLVRDEETGELRPASWPEALRRRGARPVCRRRRRCRRAHRWPADRRGRLRLQQVRPARARHQRHRLPGPRALRRGGRLPRVARGRTEPAGWRRRTYADLEKASVVLLVGLRARGRVADRLPAAAQGRAERDEGRLPGAVHLARPAARWAAA